MYEIPDIKYKISNISNIANIKNILIIPNSSSLLEISIISNMSNKKKL